MQNLAKPTVNPLASFMRQPKVFISLPSKGQWWPPGSIVMPENGEFPVYSMTAKDELLFKTPDALMNGQAVVDVIQSCIPNIKNAWMTPTIDLDYILIAIRLATYGEKMPLKHKIPNIDEEAEHDVDLRMLLDQLNRIYWHDQVIVNDQLILFVRPLTYKNMTMAGLKSFETTKIMTLVNDDTISEEKKLEIFNSSFQNLTKLTIDLLAESIYKVVTPDTEVTDKRHISEFVANADKEIFKLVQDHLKALKENNDLKPLEFTTTEEQQAAGAPASYSVPINFNDSDFFG